MSINAYVVLLVTHLPIASLWDRYIISSGWYTCGRTSTALVRLSVVLICPRLGLPIVKSVICVVHHQTTITEGWIVPTRIL